MSISNTYKQYSKLIICILPYSAKHHQWYNYHSDHCHNQWGHYHNSNNSNYRDNHRYVYKFEIVYVRQYFNKYFGQIVLQLDLIWKFIYRHLPYPNHALLLTQFQVLPVAQLQQGPQWPLLRVLPQLQQLRLLRPPLVCILN